MKNILIIGNLSDNKFESKISPLLSSKRFDKFFLFRSRGNFLNNESILSPPFPLAVSNKFLRIVHDMYNFLYYSSLMLFSKVDCIIGIYLYPHGFYASLLGNIFKKPVILILTGTDQKRLIKEKKHVKIFKKAAFWGVRGTHSKNSLESIGVEEEKIFILHNLFNIEKYKPMINIKKDFDILSIGFLRKPKRINYVLDTVAKLKLEFPKIKCLIVGDGDEKSRLIKHAQDLSLLGNIKFRDYHKNVERDINASRILLFTSESEGLPMVILESMSCGVPVVASDIDDIPDVIEHNKNGYLINPNSKDDYYKFCYDLLTNVDKYNSFAREARSKIEMLYLENYSRSKILKSWNKVFKFLEL